MSASTVTICRQARKKGLVGLWDGVPGLGLALVSGPEGPQFLQSRLTSDVLSLAPGQGQLSAKLTARGQLVGYFSLHRMPDLGQPFPSYLLLAAREDLEILLADLASTLIGEEVLLEDVSTQFRGLVIQGPEADPFLERILGRSAVQGVTDYSLGVVARGQPLSPTVDCPGDLMILSRSFTGDPGRILLWGAESSGGGVAEALLAAAKIQSLVLLDQHPPSIEAWKWLSVEAGWPRLGSELETSRTLLPSTGLEQQVASLSKGCYPGQEVVARIRTYGSVPTALRGLEFSDGDPDMMGKLPDPGQELTAGDRKIGSWGTAAWSVNRGRMIALAFLDRDHRAPGTRQVVDTLAGPLEAEVVLLPFFRATDQGARAQHLHDQAIRLFSEGNDERAVLLLEQSVRLDPGYKDAYEALGVILGREEKFMEAIDIFRRLEEVAPEEPMVHTNLSLFYMKIGDQDEAERQKSLATFKRFSTATDPGAARDLQEEAEAAQAKEAERRIMMFAEVLEFDPEDPVALMGLGKAHAELGQNGQADTYLAQALTAQPENSALYALRGKVLEALGRPEQAGETYRQGVEIASRQGDLMPLKDMEHRLLLLQV
jgi:folate-binding protein YgfZ